MPEPEMKSPLPWQLLVAAAAHQVFRECSTPPLDWWRAEKKRKIKALWSIDGREGAASQKEKKSDLEKAAIDGTERVCWVLRCVDVLYLGVQVKSDRVPTQIVIKGKTIGKA